MYLRVVPGMDKSFWPSRVRFKDMQYYAIVGLALSFSRSHDPTVILWLPTVERFQSASHPRSPLFLRTIRLSSESVVLGIGDLHGRIMIVDSSVADSYTEHGNVALSCFDGGPFKSRRRRRACRVRRMAALPPAIYCSRADAARTIDLAGLSADTSFFYL
jgi:hypothetical protein